MTAIPARSANGTFAPGHSGNPGGRVGLPADLREALENAAPKAVSRLVELVGSKDGKLALAASEALLSRLYGKPPMAVDATVNKGMDFAAMHLAALKHLADKARSVETVEEALTVDHVAASGL